MSFQSSLQVTSASAQGQRSHQEDRWISEPLAGGYLLGVFDGHRGAAVAEKASQEFIPLFKAALKTHPENMSETLREVFTVLDKATRDQSAGSTASVVFIPHNAQNVHLAVLGDSPIAILNGDGKIHFGPDHNIRTNLKERSASQERGGVFYGGYLEDPQLPGVGLQMARSLGDADLSRVLSRDPEIETVTLGGNGIVLVGTDGLFLPGGGPNADQLTRLLTLIHRGADAQALVQDALDRETGDNVTALVWKA